MEVSKLWLDWAALVGGVGGGLAALAVGLAWWQLLLMKRHTVTAFEDALVQEYRELASTLPLKALLGQKLTDKEHVDKLDEFYRYFDLCNYQAFLRTQGRVSEATWTFWKEGIQTNMARPAFSRAWSEIAAKASDDFDELRSLSPPEPVNAGEEAL